jgi:mRNA-degrading endonuclease RelE of RelBE toxin-antitoxin system
MQTVVELSAFSRRAEKLFAAEEREALIAYVARNPSAGMEIPGTGGVRKLRFGTGSRGKRGGARVIYYVYDDTAPIYLLLAYGKNERADLTPDEKRRVAALAAALKVEFKGRRK